MLHVSWFPWFCVHHFRLKYAISCPLLHSLYGLSQYSLPHATVSNSNTCPQQPWTQCYHLHSGIQSNQSRLFKTQNRIKAEVASSTIHTQFNTKPFPILDLESALSIYELQCASVVKFSQIKGFYNRTPPFQPFMQCWIRYWHSHFENGTRGMSLAHSQIYYFQHNKLHCLKLALIKITLVKKKLGGLPQASFR